MTTPTIEEMTTALQKLGCDYTSVANTLRKQKIKGQKTSSLFCPVACYLKKCFPPHRFYVGNKRAMVDGRVYLPLPPAVGDFVSYFDDGYFPDLEKETL